MVGHLILGGLVSWWISSTFSINFWLVAAVIGLLVAARHFGWFGLTASPIRGGGMTAGMTRFLVGFSTLTFVMMVGTKIIGVSNNYAFSVFFGLGPRPWLYPSNTPTDILIWVSLFVLSVGIALLTANGRYRLAIWIFAVTLVFLFVYREMPSTAEYNRPHPKVVRSPRPGETQAWADADRAVQENGAPFEVACTVAKWGTGERHGLEGWVRDWLCNSKSQPTQQVVFATPVADDKPATEATPACEWAWSEPIEIASGQAIEETLVSGWKIEAVDGAITIVTPSGKALREEPGVNRAVGRQTDGKYILQSDPSDQARKVRVYNCWSKEQLQQTP